MDPKRVDRCLLRQQIEELELEITVLRIINADLRVELASAQRPNNWLKMWLSRWHDAHRPESHQHLSRSISERTPDARQLWSAIVDPKAEGARNDCRGALLQTARCGRLRFSWYGKVVEDLKAQAAFTEAWKRQRREWWSQWYWKLPASPGYDEDFHF
ncbi:unnamed protein product [Zymoseptoria tritici ST99CH_3D1]|uniref:Uncharacterized protein n=1 Tax=Zymoseptoria tritici ST99CH_1E4 TaxID=1276532 RepID=A0A2H1H8D7_ZYMTR|nr:unnamed protein product [Zymoseptoria tritici ST99CH_1E4]SMR64581.1 unnamed protein product [Zymoseptoria tritici ST99CH_3D1]